MKLSVMGKKIRTFQLGTGSYTAFNYCGNFLRYNTPHPPPSSVSRPQLKDMPGFTLISALAVGSRCNKWEGDMFYLVQGKDHSRARKVAVQARISGGCCAPISHCPRRCTHAYAHTHRQRNKCMCGKLLYSAWLQWKKEFHCPPPIGINSKSMESKQSRANIDLYCGY